MNYLDETTQNLFFLVNTIIIIFFLLPIVFDIIADFFVKVFNPKIKKDEN
jgi:ABC-type dipeptide/oligopeptide/nickel transport system permease component